MSSITAWILVVASSMLSPGATGTGSPTAMTIGTLVRPRRLG